MKIGRIESVWRYPVKSMRGERLEEGFVSYSGVYGDRVYAFHNAAARVRFPYLTARVREQMLLYQPRFLDDGAAARPVNMEAGTPFFTDRSGFAVEVTAPDGRRFAIDDPALIADLKAGLPTDDPISLMHSGRAFTDSRPISLFSRQTVRQISEESGMPLDQRRFRANLYADFDAGGGFAENELVGRTLGIGEKAVVTVVALDPRCKMITLDPDTAEVRPEILRRLTQNHQGMAGLYCAVLQEGTVRPGDEIRAV